MKKFIFILLCISAILFSCLSIDYDISNSKTKTKDGYTIIIIDSCEYIKRGQSLTHKGNCKYCEDRIIKMLKNKKQL